MRFLRLIDRFVKTRSEYALGSVDDFTSDEYRNQVLEQVPLGDSDNVIFLGEINDIGVLGMLR